MPNIREFKATVNNINNKLMGQMSTAMLSDSTSSGFWIKRKARIDKLFDELEFAWVYWLERNQPVYEEARYKELKKAKREIPRLRNLIFEKKVGMDVLNNFFNDYLIDFNQVITDSKRQSWLLLRLLELNNKQEQRQVEAFLEEEEIETILREAEDYSEARLAFIDELENFVDEDKLLVTTTKTGKTRKYKIKTYTDRLMRTSIRELQTKGVLDAAAFTATDLVQVSDHGTICPICIEFEGKIYSVSGRNPHFPALIDAPPYHPYCQHSLSLVFQETLERLDLYQPYSDFSLGNTDVHPEIKDWVPVHERNIA
jgi:tRNA-binding EMAP/Myf-like protein